MENDSNKFVSRIAIFIVVLIFSQSLSVLSYGLDSVESKKIELLSQILYARDSGDLTTAREKAEKLIEIEPNDENIQKLLLSINAKIVQEGLLDEVLLLESNKGVTKEKNNSEDQVSEELYSHVVGREFSSEFIEQSHIINELLIIGFSQKNIGDYDSATKTFNEVLSRDPNNIRAKDGLIEIARELDNINERNLIKTREEMLGSINDSWDRPRNFEFKSSIKNIDQKESELKQRLERIILPKINFTGIELTEVIDTLSELSLEHDPDEEGVNIVVLFNPSVSNPKVNMTLRNLSLDRVLEFITQQVNFTYDIGDDAITIQPSDSLGRGNQLQPHIRWRTHKFTLIQ